MTVIDLSRVEEVQPAPEQRVEIHLCLCDEFAALKISSPFSIFEIGGLTTTSKG